jgi:hypothetical protein
MNNLTSPTISVVMAVKNGGTLLAGAVESILNQTYTDFEFIIINDGSTDDTLTTLAKWNDPRLQIVSQANQGLAKSLNRGISLSRGNFIARQDHDDLSLPQRLEKQLAYMQSHPQCGLLGTAAEIWSLEGPTGRFHDHPCDSGVLAFELLFNNPFVHTSWMLRKDIVKTVGVYTTDPEREPPEDYEYVSRIVRHFDVANLPERLVIYREMHNSLSSLIRPQNRVLNNPFSERLALVSSENIAHASGLGNTNDATGNFGALTHNYPKGFSISSTCLEVKALLIRATQALAKRYPQAPLPNLLSDRLAQLYYQFAYQRYLHSSGVSSVIPFWHYAWYRVVVAIAVRYHRLVRSLRS